MSAALLFAASAQAAYNVTIAASGSDSNGSWVGNIWTPSANGSTVLASEVVTHLTAGPTAIVTTGGGTDLGDINVNAAVSWSANTLTLTATKDINVNAALIGTATAALVLEYGQGAVAAGNTATYRLNTPVKFTATATGSFGTKRGSDGSTVTRIVPTCPVTTRSGTTYGCQFLKNSDLTALTIEYRTHEVNAAADTDKWIYVNGFSLFASGITLYPYVMSCLAGQGQLYYPNSTDQTLYFDGTGAITDLPNLALFTATTRTCKTWDQGPVAQLFSSTQFPNGYYIKFTPTSGQSGYAYQTMSILFTDQPQANTGYVVVDYIINVLDTTPDAFSFTAQTGVALSSVETSNTLSVAGINSASTISIAGGSYSINGGAYTSVAGTVNNNDTVTLQQTSSASYSTLTTATLTIGGVSGAFNVTTQAIDTTPATFSFTAQVGAALSTVATSSSITVSGINAATHISISAGGSYSINSTPYTSNAGTVSNNDTVTLQQTSSASYSTLTTATLTIGGVSGAFDVTTLAAPPSYTGATATGTGSATATVSGGGVGCGFNSAQFFPLNGNEPAGISFSQGLFNFTLNGCTPGGTVTLNITYPSAVPAGTQYWKYGPTPGNSTPHWYTIPATISGNTITFSITDGGTGDDDLNATNGVIVDQGGP
jgi:hypothetical protein